MVAASEGTAESQAYTPFQFEGLDDELAVWQWRWLGRILVIHLPGGVVYIGPHWYCCFVMLTFILGVGVFFVSGMSVEDNPLPTYGGVLATMLSTITFIRCALSDPGVVRKKASAQDAMMLETGSSSSPPESDRYDRQCNFCNLEAPRGSAHCEFCEVCIVGFDHHCPWMGKCIGKNNLCKFYTFITTSMLSLGYIFLVTLVQTPD